MAGRWFKLIDRFIHRRAVRRWGRLRDRAAAASLQELRGIRVRARETRRLADRVLFVADSRLTLPLVGSNAVPRPLHSDWAWRPEAWRGPIQPPGIAAAPSRAPIGGELTLFHDCRISELTVRQVRNTREKDIAPFGLRLDVFRFDGSFLSLALELPHEAVDGLHRRHLLHLALTVEMESPLEIFARLNILHGPNTEQMVLELPVGAENPAVDFDLAYSKLNEKRIERAWVDLIFDGPEMNQIVLRDLTMSRRPRAEV